MKNSIAIIMFLITLFAGAQESFPGKHPELLMGKEVKVIDATESAEKYGYGEFFLDAVMKTVYSPMPGAKYNSTKESLFGKTFKVANVELTDEKYTPTWRVTLVGLNNETIYYQFSKLSEPRYPFEVIGGLTVPDGFYCDLVTQSKFGETDTYEALTGMGSRVRKDVKKGISDYSLTLVVFSPKEAKIVQTATLVLEGNKTLVVNTSTIIPSISSNSFKYNFTTMIGAKEMAVLKTNKIIGVKFGGIEAPLSMGTKMQGVLNCLTK